MSGTFLRTCLECPAPHVCEVPQKAGRWRRQRFAAGAIWRCVCGQVWYCDYSEPEPDPPGTSALALGWLKWWKVSDSWAEDRLGFKLAPPLPPSTVRHATYP